MGRPRYANRVRIFFWQAVCTCAPDGCTESATLGAKDKELVLMAAASLSVLRLRRCFSRPNCRAMSSWALSALYWLSSYSHCTSTASVKPIGGVSSPRARNCNLLVAAFAILHAKIRWRWKRFPWPDLKLIAFPLGGPFRSAFNWTCLYSFTSGSTDPKNVAVYDEVVLPQSTSSSFIPTDTNTAYVSTTPATILTDKNAAYGVSSLNTRWVE